MPAKHIKRQGRSWYHWYSEDDTPEERRLIVKLDLLIVPYAVIAYWIKYIDQSNLSKFNLQMLLDNSNCIFRQCICLGPTRGVGVQQESAGQLERYVCNRSSHWSTTIHISVPYVSDELYHPSARSWLGYLHAFAIPYTRIF